MAQLKDYLRRYPDLFKGKIVTYSVDNQFGYTAFWGYAQQGGWPTLDALGPATKPQPDGVAIVRQLASGAANFAYLEAGLVRGNLTGALAQIVGWKYMSDFTPLIPRGIAVTKAAGNPAGAETFVNWLFSPAGQQAMCGAGFTAFRKGVSCQNSVAAIQKAVGASHVFFVPFHSSIAADHDAFVKRWQRSFR
jgi:iron(III) transport system substrate-binding protein